MNNDGKDLQTGRFVQGNEFWKMRSRHGNTPEYDSPEKLKEACEDYFEWVSKAPLYEDKVGFYEGEAVHTAVSKMHAMTIGGLCIFIDVTFKTWTEWRKNRPDLCNVIEWAESVIKQQKFAGAAAGLLNANIIARDLGLTDKTDVTSAGDKLKYVTLDMGDKKLDQQDEDNPV